MTKTMKATNILVLIVLAMQAPLPARTHPGSRHSRQDLRMLPANSTGTPQDQALAGGLVPPEASPTPVPADGTAAGSGASPGPATTTFAASTTTATAAVPTTAASPPAAAGLRRTQSSPSMLPVFGQERIKHKGSASEFAAEDTNIVFPTPGKPSPTKLNPAHPSPVPGRAAPPCANGSTFCTNVDNYPENYLQTMLRSASVGFREFFGNDVVNDETNITQRIDANDEMPLCPYEETVVYPKLAKNKEDQWLYVVNQDRFVQGVRIETCLNSGTSCQLAENFPFGYTTSCRQKYILRKLVALKPEGHPQPDMFRFPSCCSCYVSRSNVSSRRSNVTPVIKKSGSRKR